MNAIGRAHINAEMILDAAIGNYVRHILMIPFLSLPSQLKAWALPAR
jgi:hypothetical protein